MDQKNDRDLRKTYLKKYRNFKNNIHVSQKMFGNLLKKFMNPKQFMNL